MGAKMMQLKMLVSETEEELEKYDKKDLVDADLLKAKKAMAYEELREIIESSSEEA